MMPIHPSTFVSYALAVFAGFLFGFVLQRAGFGSANKLAAQFYLRDMTVLKVMFTAIVTAMLGLTLLTAVGVVSYDQIYINPTFLAPQIVGGVVFGVGFVIGGYCPGTSVVAAVTGRIDAIVFVLGAGAGILAYAGLYPSLAWLAQLGSGERELLPELFGVSHGTVAFGVTLMAIGMFVGAEVLEHWMAKRDAAKAAPDAPKLDTAPSDRAEPAGRAEGAAAHGAH